jgi:hypothetical protein
MELAGSTYLLALAAIAITFVSFSTVAVVLWQAQGAALSAYDALLLRLFMVSGLIATVFSLIPPLLALFRIAPPLLWRVSSLFFGLLLLWREIYFFRRHTRVAPGRMPASNYLLYGMSALVVLGLLVNAIVLPEPGPGLYALAATWWLVNSVISFIMVLGRLLQPPKNSHEALPGTIREPPGSGPDF